MIADKQRSGNKMKKLDYNEELKHHYEKALEHLLILEDMTDYELKDISNMIDKLQDMNFED